MKVASRHSTLLSELAHKESEVNVKPSRSRAGREKKSSKKEKKSISKQEPEGISANLQFMSPAEVRKC